VITINEVRVDQWVFGGLLAISLVILQAFISSGTSDLTSTITVFAFAFAVPQLAIATLISIIDKDRKLDKFEGPTKISTWVYFILLMLTLLSDCVGIITAFWHYSWIAGIVALMSGCIGFIYLVFWEYQL